MLMSGTLNVFVLLLGICTGSFLNNSFVEFNTPTNFINKVKVFVDSKDNGVSLKCSSQVKGYIDGLGSKEWWALRMLDAGAKIPSGMLEGNVVDLGFFDECLKVEGNTKMFKIFGKYCIGTIPLDVIFKQLPRQMQQDFQMLSNNANRNPKMLTRMYGIYGIHLATCLPDACTAAEIQKLYAAVIGSDIMIFKEEMCQSKASMPELNGGSIAMLSFLGVILGIMLVATTYDVIMYYLESKPAHPLLIAFSVFTNGKKIMATSNSPYQIKCMHGIRVITTMWIILAHRYHIKTRHPIQNFITAFNFLRDEANMFILSATVSVDTFFLISGLVLVYVYMNATAKGNKFNIFLFYLHRYLRLTPVLAVVALIHITLLKHLGSGPLWPTQTKHLITACEKNWWQSLLYIQNYENSVDMCVLQSWYLGVDTQLYILSPLLLIPLKFWPKFTLTAAGFLAVCSIIACFLTAWFYELTLSWATLAFNPEKNQDYMNFYYYPTWTRAAPWFIGLILGYFIFKLKQRKSRLVINKLILLTLWATALAILLTCVFTGHDLFTKENDRLETSFYVALVRPSWSIAVGWVIFGCASGNGGPVNWFLSLPVFQVISKLTFTLYMVHVTVLYIIIAQVRTPTVFDNPHVMYLFWGDFAFSLVVALIATLAFESPMIAIAQALLGGKQNKTEKLQITETTSKTLA